MGVIEDHNRVMDEANAKFNKYASKHGDKGLYRKGRWGGKKRNHRKKRK